jgi:hypothetical protein
MSMIDEEEYLIQEIQRKINHLNASEAERRVVAKAYDVAYELLTNDIDRLNKRLTTVTAEKQFRQVIEDFDPITDPMPEVQK